MSQPSLFTFRVATVATLAAPAPAPVRLMQVERESPGIQARKLEHDSRYDGEAIRAGWPVPWCWMPADRLPDFYARALLEGLSAQRRSP